MDLSKEKQSGRYGRKAKRTRKNPTIKVPESGLQKQYQDTCNALGVKNIHLPGNFCTWFHHAHKAGNVPDKVYNDFWEVFKGMPDNISLIPIGEIFNLAYTPELKTLKGRLSKDQKAWSKETNVPILRTTEENENGVKEFVKEAERLMSLLTISKKG